MKDKSKKHVHRGTKLLKLSIFFTIMLAPILAIAFKCAYTTFNKNAYQSYYGETINEKTYTNNLEILNVNNDYEFNTIEIPSSQQTSNYIYVSSITNLQNVPTSSIYYTEIQQATAFSIYYNSNINSYSLRYIYNGQTRYYSFATIESNSFSPFTFNFEVTADYTNNNSDLQKYLYLIEYNKNSYLDNAFYYAIEEMQESTLFNWTENTAIYTPIQAMTSGLGITTDAIAILLTYWMYITLIYIVFDIVIELFTYLTHTLMGQPM